jgi:two-component system response regulator (stage 0 sporulation protein F)
MVPARHRLLIVDDQEAILFAMQEYLASLGYLVDCARDRAEATALLDHRAYDVVIADLRLTPLRDDDGLELLSLVRERAPETRTILLTAYGSPAVERAAQWCGADVVLQKPQPLGALAQIVAGLLADRA